MLDNREADASDLRLEQAKEEQFERTGRGDEEVEEQQKKKRHKEAHMLKDKAERVVPYGAKPDPRRVTHDPISEEDDSDATTLLFGRSQPSPSWLAPPTSTGAAPEVFVVEPTHCKGCGTPLPPETAGSRCGPCHLAPFSARFDPERVGGRP